MCIIKGGRPTLCHSLQLASRPDGFGSKSLYIRADNRKLMRLAFCAKLKLWRLCDTQAKYTKYLELSRVGARNKKSQQITVGSGEAPAGFEPAIADLQSAALATWPRRRGAVQVELPRAAVATWPEAFLIETAQRGCDTRSRGKV